MRSCLRSGMLRVLRPAYRQKSKKPQQVQLTPGAARDTIDGRSAGVAPDEKSMEGKGTAYMRIKAVIWDLDGTLLNTLADLAASTNAALRENGLPERTQDEVRAFVGNGIRLLIERAVPDGAENPMFQQVYDAFVRHYGAHSRDRTRPYEGIIPLLDELGKRGVKLAIVSNKIDFAVKELSSAYFGDRMQVAVGDDPLRRKKPAPDSVLEAMRQLGVTAGETVYVGDSDVDVRTAQNAGIPCCAVSWGFRSEACLRAAGAEHIAATPDELLTILEAL